MVGRDANCPLHVVERAPQIGKEKRMDKLLYNNVSNDVGMVMTMRGSSIKDVDDLSYCAHIWLLPAICVPVGATNRCIPSSVLDNTS